MPSATTYDENETANDAKRILLLSGVPSAYSSDSLSSSSSVGGAGEVGGGSGKNWEVAVAGVAVVVRGRRCLGACLSLTLPWLALIEVAAK